MPSVRFSWLAAPVVAAALALDQATKLHCEAAFLLSDRAAASHHVPSALLFALGVPPLQVRLGSIAPAAITPSWLAVEMTHVSNRGITLGLLESAHPLVPVAAFYATTFVGVAMGGLALYRARGEPAFKLGGLALCTGVVANLLDRLRIGYVIDWLVIGWRWAAWQVELPAFNFGDAYIVLGAVLLGIGLLRRRWNSSRPRPIVSR